MLQMPSLVAAFLHACWLIRCSPVVAEMMMPVSDDVLQPGARLDDSDDFLHFTAVC